MLSGLLITSGGSGLETFSISNTQALHWEHGWIMGKGFVCKLLLRNQRLPVVTFQSLEALSPTASVEKVIFLG